ncbi:3-methyladenine DNA glycosylase [Niabella ginsenosidivorans]|uniref:DNA-3-methyladenine glycosylase II n=1 Tax=Niabella ginsenosidivorans TaxID=1176587 RepID=A0A1A9I0F3_9BACT|nr:DNA-3-methyladenine glycosylase [Niabella ginsenosidivorans]ANH80211.1 3-methyladenine DNA glycosylase [Niabella ginsenosidivorans]
MIQTFSGRNFKKICNQLAKKDAHLAAVLEDYGHPPMWTRANSFESLVHIILEQQVSLASALAALRKLQKHTKGVTLERILKLTDAEMRACYVSRQKMGYIRGLAQAIIDGQINLEVMAGLPDDEVRKRLTALKGIGNWTVDVYLIFVLQRTDVFPVGDLAAVNAFKKLKSLPKTITREELTTASESWAPHRTIATMILWHFYLSERYRLLRATV